MANIYPTITANDIDEYRRQVLAVQDFAEGLHIDLMDGELTPSHSPNIDQIWWPEQLQATIHLMYRRPMNYLDELIALNPYMLVIHFEAEVDHSEVASKLQSRGIKSSLAILQQTSVTQVESILSLFDQLLVFSGHLGYQGGQADLGLIDKVVAARDIKSDLEIAWDGGINDQNAKELVSRGVSVLNVGSFIQGSPDPKAAYDKLKASI